MPETRTLDDRRKAARLRFARLMKVTFGASVAVLVLAFALFYAKGTPMTLPFIGAITVAVVGSLMIAAALMGLLFFSSASGADDSADKRDH